ncbi:MAG TPA: recombinase family protein, partial [Candidatus Tectomicrobia bacterium]
MRELAQQQLINILIIYASDRLSRKLAHTLYLKEEFMRAGVSLCFVTTPVTGHTPESDLQDNMQGVFAEYERLKILERTKRGLVGRAKSGRPPGGFVTLGYRYVRTETELPHYEIVPEEAALVRRIVDMYVKEGLPMNAIAKQLTCERIPTHRDRRGVGPQRKLAPGIWSPASVQRILTNETYTGTLYYNKNEHMESKADPGKKTRWRLRPKEEWIAIEVPRILPQELFDAAQRQRGQNARTSRRNRKHDYLLTHGILRCGQCGRFMQGFCFPKNGILAYRCSRPRWQSDTPC